MENQKESLMAYQDFSNLLSKDINGDPIYPDNYAGEYIDENGDLVFLSVDSSLAQDPNYRSFFQQYAGCVKEEAATYSINQLKQYKEFVQRLYNDGVMVSSSGIDVLNNCYFINTWEKSENRTPYMLTAMASSAMPIRFETEEGICQTASSLYGGQGLTNEDSCTFSVGIGGTYNGQSAILTCGHKNGNINGRGQYISYSGTRIGQVVYQRCNTNPNNTSSSS